jgi:DNA-binding IclR family transcriptional regulator
MTEVPIQSAKQAFDVLETLAVEGESSLAEVEEELAVPRSTAHDYLTTLRHLEYVVKRGNRYRASSRALGFGIRVRENLQLFQVAEPEIDELADETGEHVSLMVEEHDLGVLLSIVEGEQAFDLGVSEGSRMALSTNAPGKAMLANMPEERVREVLDRRGLPAITAATITDSDELFAELEAIRERGYAADMGERVEGVRAVSVPIVTRNQVHGALTVSGPTKRMSGTRFREEIPDRLSRAANVIEVQYTLDGNRS